MATKQVVVDDQTYKLGTITVDQAEEVFSNQNPRQQNKALVAASLVAGGMQDASVENVGKMFYHHYIQVLNAALEVNGMTTKPATGEAAAAQG